MWHRIIKADRSKVLDFIDFFEKEAVEAQKDVDMKGSIEKLAMAMPGIVEFRFRQLQEIEAVLSYFENELKRARVQAYQKIIQTNQRSMTSSDVWKWVDNDKDVYDLCELINEVAFVRNKFVSISKGLDQKSWMLGHVVKLRVVGLEDATL